MANEFNKRPRFQMHLSTAVILTLVAGGLIWANTRFYVYHSLGIIDDSQSRAQVPTKGWPAPYGQTLRDEFRWSSIPLVLDVFISLFILVLLAISLEGWIQIGEH